MTQNTLKRMPNSVGEHTSDKGVVQALYGTNWACSKALLPASLWKDGPFNEEDLPEIDLLDKNQNKMYSRTASLRRQALLLRRLNARC